MKGTAAIGRPRLKLIILGVLLPCAFCACTRATFPNAASSPAAKTSAAPNLYQQAMAQSDYRIVGGRVGPIRLGMYMDEVAKILGQPEEARQMNGEPALNLPRRMFTKWMYDRANFQVSFSEGPAPWVNSITIFDDTRFETEKGLKIGMSTFDAVRMYGDDLLIICVGEKVYLTVGKHRGTYQINMITVGIDEHCHV